MNTISWLNYHFPTWKPILIVATIVTLLCGLGNVVFYKNLNNNILTVTPTSTQTPFEPYIIVEQPVTEIVNCLPGQNSYIEKQIAVPQDRLVYADRLIPITVQVPMTIIVEQWSTVQVPMTVISTVVVTATPTEPLSYPNPNTATLESSIGEHPNGATAICNDRTYSYSQTRSGTCSYHGGVYQWLIP